MRTDGSRTSGDSMSSPNASKPLPLVVRKFTAASERRRSRRMSANPGRYQATMRMPAWCAASTNAAVRSGYTNADGRLKLEVSR